MSQPDILTKTDQKALDAAAKRGAKLVAKEDPEWANHIRVTKFNLKDGATCVLGELYGDYSVGLDRLGDHVDPARYGFCADPKVAYRVQNRLDVSGDYWENEEKAENIVYAYLQRAWVRLIEANRTRRKASRSPLWEG